MGKALYRKHRPKKLSEIIGQEHITETLSRALKNNTFSHAYLLTGPRGIGKTSVARIMAYEVNNLPYDEEATHMDIIEIDAASNRRIDEIRELKERVNIAPTTAKFKVYIIDEVHMLTKEAFNALLKTLEEPPEHVIFVLATTEAHKVPETIISRTQRFSFKPVETAKVADHLGTIAKTENIKIDKNALELIAQHGEGSFRDSISLLDQVRHVNDEISLADVQQAIGQAPDELINQVVENIATSDIQKIGQSINQLRDHGVQSAQIAQQLSKSLRNELINEKSTLGAVKSLNLLTDLLLVPSNSDPNLALELALYKTALENTLNTISTVTEEPKTAGNPVEPKPTAPQIETSDTSTNTSKPKKASLNAKRRSMVADNTLDSEAWQNVLNAVKAKQNTLYGIARMATPKFEEGKLILVFSFAFHFKKFDDAKNKQFLQEMIYQSTGHEIDIFCELDKDSQKPQTETIEPETSTVENLEAISNIFGGAEIVE